MLIKNSESNAFAYASAPLVFFRASAFVEVGVLCIWSVLAKFQYPPGFCWDFAGVFETADIYISESSAGGGWISASLMLCHSNFTGVLKVMGQVAQLVPWGPASDVLQIVLQGTGMRRQEPGSSRYTAFCSTVADISGDGRVTLAQLVPWGTAF